MAWWDPMRNKRKRDGVAFVPEWPPPPEQDAKNPLDYVMRPIQRSIPPAEDIARMVDAAVSCVRRGVVDRVEIGVLGNLKITVEKEKGHDAPRTIET